MEYTSEDIRIQIERLKELIDKNADIQEIKSEQLKLNQLLEKYLIDKK